ncbi:MAG: Fur family transcriptional regulator [Geminicoccaceae bacterium]
MNGFSPATETTLARLEGLCRQRGERMTAPRRRVLGILLEAEEPLGAYELIERMAKVGSRPTPPTVYRALDFLVSQGFVHKVHSENGFIACKAVEEVHEAELFICRTCGVTAEVARSLSSVKQDASALGFTAESVVVEVRGLCRGCKDRT